jgi:hypothetical protein
VRVLVDSGRYYTRHVINVPSEDQRDEVDQQGFCVYERVVTISAPTPTPGPTATPTLTPWPTLAPTRAPTLPPVPTAVPTLIPASVPIPTQPSHGGDEEVSLWSNPVTVATITAVATIAAAVITAIAVLCAARIGRSGRNTQ